MSDKVWLATIIVALFVTQLSHLFTYRDFKRRIERLESHVDTLRQQVRALFYEL